MLHGWGLAAQAAAATRAPRLCSGHPENNSLRQNRHYFRRIGKIQCHLNQYE
jgi:TPP-dependent indolepyruvate ferredoxin oxidoreductase alpha subunit